MSSSYVIVKQNEYIRKFRRAGATDAKTARPLADLGVKPGHIFGKMEDRAVFRPGRTPGTYYMDPAAAEDFIRARRRRALYMMLLALAAFLVLFLIGRR